MDRQPVLFVSHGAPTFALEPGRAGALLTALGARLSPAAVLVVSPHWMPRDLAVTAAALPETVHDFGGFPPALYQLHYPAPGSPDLARRIVELFASAGLSVRADSARGLDHGAWVPLMHLFPQAVVPVVQLSLPASLDTHGAWRMGELLAPLRDEGVLVLGSGSLTHNLQEIFSGNADADTGYAQEFVAWARAALLRHDSVALMDYLRVAPHGRRAHPTADHYLPLLIAAAAGGSDARVTVLDGGTTYGVLSMESYVFGVIGQANRICST
jgi:4,5-DOPA dioxygenase extradiol